LENAHWYEDFVFGSCIEVEFEGRNGLIPDGGLDSWFTFGVYYACDKIIKAEMDKHDWKFPENECTREWIIDWLLRRALDLQSEELYRLILHPKIFPQLNKQDMLRGLTEKMLDRSIETNRLYFTFDKALDYVDNRNAVENLIQELVVFAVNTNDERFLKLLGHQKLLAIYPDAEQLKNKIFMDVSFPKKGEPKQYQKWDKIFDQCNNYSQASLMAQQGFHSNSDVPELLKQKMQELNLDQAQQKEGANNNNNKLEQARDNHGVLKRGVRLLAGVKDGPEIEVPRSSL
jgi:hypothetical protein